MESTAKDHYTLRRLSPSQWEQYKSIRLEALKIHPEMFGSPYSKEAAYNQSDWVTFLQNDTRATFALYCDQSLIGLTGVSLKKDDPTTAILFSSFIQPAHRGKGLSRLFFQARMDWARQKKCKALIVSHRVGNDLSKAAIQRFGFTYTHAEEVNWPDGVHADALMYRLELSIDPNGSSV